MWRPRTEAEIQAAIDNDLVRETSSFDAKQQLPPAGRNKDLAKDICAMSGDGGTLLYGIGGQDPTRPDELMPFDLAGGAERIDQVAQTGIAEPLVPEVYDIPSDQQPGLGYLCVIVPASPRAPHMLTIDRDNRYWGRGATGNRILSEGEVARLYERRERWELDRGELLSRAIDALPFTFNLRIHGAVLVLTRPVMPGRELLRIAAGERPVDQFLQQDLTRIGREADPYPDQGTPGLGDAYAVRRVGADLWVSENQPNSGPAYEYQARVEITATGELTYWHSPVISSRNEE